MELGAIDGEREKGYRWERKSIKKVGVISVKGMETFFSFLLLELPKNPKGLLQILPYMGVGWKERRNC